jgi:hypothetical protein
MLLPGKLAVLRQAVQQRVTWQQQQQMAVSCLLL